MAENEMVERVAKAICMACFGGYPVSREERERWPQWTHMAVPAARAAIGAMREPTEAMKARAANIMFGRTREQMSEIGKGEKWDALASEYAEAYEYMIDAAVQSP